MDLMRRTQGGMEGERQREVGSGGVNTPGKMEAQGRRCGGQEGGSSDRRVRRLNVRATAACDSGLRGAFGRGRGNRFGDEVMRLA